MANTTAVLDPSFASLDRSKVEPAPVAGATAPAINALPDIDRTLHAATARLTGGFAPSALAGAYLDWITHLAANPGRRMQLAGKAATGVLESLAFASRSTLGSEEDPGQGALPQDNQFLAPEWRTYPFNVYARAFLSVERWWETATTNIRGLGKRHEDMVTFAARQFLDMMAPSNFVCTNPQVLARTQAEAGLNLIRGSLNLAEDLMRAITGESPAGSEAFVVGKTVAATTGKVVCRTPLAEIIQYAAVTEAVRPEPIVSFPPGS